MVVEEALAVLVYPTSIGNVCEESPGKRWSNKRGMVVVQAFSVLIYPISIHNVFAGKQAGNSGEVEDGCCGAGDVDLSDKK